MDFITILQFPPFSSLFIVLVSIVFSLFSVVLTRRLTDRNRLNSLTEETKKFDSIKIKANKTQNKKLLHFVKKINSNMP